MAFFDTFKVTKPKVEQVAEITEKQEKPPARIPADLWVKCKGCDTPIYKKVLDEKLKVCDKCGFHHKMSSWERLELLTEPGTFKEMDATVESIDPLEFGGDYPEKLKGDQKKTRLKDAILTGTARVAQHHVAIGIMEFNFRGGSMGSVVGEKVCRVLEYAAENKLPCIMVTCSGGARMQEGVFSLMQLVKTNAAVNLMAKNKVPYIVVMTDPTTAGVAASYAAIGDVILAEPGAYIGFAGKRVIEQTIRQKLPPDFQTSEFFLKHGFIDKVVPRRMLKKDIIRILDLFYPHKLKKEEEPEENKEPETAV